MQDSDEQLISRMMDGEWDGLDPSRCAAIVCENPVARARWARYHMIRDVMHNEPVHAEIDLATRVRSLIDDEPTYSNVARLQGSARDQPGRAAAPVDVAASSPEPDSRSVLTESTGNVSVEPQRPASPPAATPPPAESPAVGGLQPVRPWGRAVSGLAVAASTALVTVVALTVFGERGVVPGSDTGDTTVASADAPAAEPPAESGVTSPGSGDTLPQVEYVANRGSHWVTAQESRQAATEERLNMFLSQHIENSPAADHQGMLPYSRLVGYDELPADR